MNNTERLAILGILTGAVAIVYTGFVHSKTKKTGDIIKESVNSISKDIEVDVSKAIIDEAVTKAVDREVSIAVKRVSSEVADGIRHDIRSKVKSSVDDSYSTIKESVSTEVAKQVAFLDIKSLRDRVKEEAKQMVLDKFNENLDSLLQDFNQNLTNVSKIYESIADKMTKKPQETILKIGV
jgi:hypothetical protein